MSPEKVKNTKLPRAKDDLDSSQNEGESALEDITMLGLYHLTKDENEVYLKFVEMLTDFDSFEIKRILHDARRDAESLTMLNSYSGTRPADRRGR
jgi:hypothetical protein